MEEPARRRVIDALSELKANSENSAIVYPFQRLKGNGTIRFDQKSYKGKLDFRLRKDEFKKMNLKYNGEKTGKLDTQNVFMKVEYKLPFICDDVFSLAEKDRYPETMFDFYFWNYYGGELN